MTCISLFLAAFALQTQTAERACEKLDEDVVNRLVERMKWQAYWENWPGDGRRTPDAVIFFWDEAVAGYCSSGLGVCTAFDVDVKGGLGRTLQSTTIESSQPLPLALSTFLSKARLPARVGVLVPRGVNEPQAGKYVDAEGREVRVPVARSGRQDDSQATGGSVLVSCVKQERTALEPPRGVVEKRRASTTDSLVLTLHALLEYGERVRNEVSEFIVPYFDEADPEVYVLRQVAGVDKEYLVMRWRAWRWHIGAHGDGEFNMAGFKLTCQRINAARMTVVRLK